MKTWAKNKHGFTIVELLIVIVVIAILAAITIVSYNGITARANDSAVKSTITQIAKQLDVYYVTTGAYPTSDAHMTSIGFKVPSGSFGQNVKSGTDEYNLLYCRPQPSDLTKYAIVASSASGVLYQYVGGVISEITRTSWDTNSIPSATLCTNSGVATSTPQVWFFQSNSWKTWAGAS